ncbi:MAG: hypothetical protein AMXMBFR83_13020 [Phycisphaerae bacterium]
MARTYPIELLVAGRPVVVVGGGRVAARKVAGLIEAGARVRVVSTGFARELQECKEVVREARPYGPDCLAEAVLVFACTDDRAVNAAVAEDARRRGILCNVVDDPAGCDFHVPAVLRRGALTLTVSSGGECPMFCAAVRDRLASQFGPEWGILAEEMARARVILKQRVADPAVRRRILETLCTDCSLKLLSADDRSAWRDWFERILAHRIERPRGASADLDEEV